MLYNKIDKFNDKFNVKKNSTLRDQDNRQADSYGTSNY